MSAAVSSVVSNEHDAASTKSNGIHEPIVEPALPPSRTKYTFTHRWFEWNRLIWEDYLSPLAAHGKKFSVLEIGAFEGASTTWLLDNLMHGHPDSTVTTVDTFAGSAEHNDQVTRDYTISSLESRFRANVARSEFASRLEVRKARSEDAVIALRAEKRMFDFVYVDGSHVAFDVLHDAAVCWHMLNVGGVMLFDDLPWDRYEQDFYNPALGIWSFVACVKPEAEVVERDGQLWVTKVENRIVPIVREGTVL